MPLPEPAGAVPDLVGEEGGPGAAGQVELDLARLVEDGGGEELGAEHELAVDVPGRLVLGELDGEGAQGEGQAGGGGRDGLGVDVGHEARLEGGPLGQGAGAALLGGVVAVDDPGHAVGAAAVQAAVAAEQAHGHPALVDPGRRGALEAADVAAPPDEAAHAQAQPAADRLGQRLGRGLAVAAPVQRQPLGPGAGGPGEDDGLLVAEPPLQGLVDHLVVGEGVVVVHPDRVRRGVVPLHVERGHALAKVRLERVDAHVEQLAEAGHVPLARRRVGDVEQAHAGLPQVPLEHVAVLALQEVPVLGRLLEQRAVLGDVRVDPDANLFAEPALLQPRDLALGVGEALRVEDEVGPPEGLHPVGVVVEHVHRRPPRLHTLQEARDGGLVVVGGEARGEPEAEAPAGYPARFPGQNGVASQDLLWRRPVDDIPLQPLALDCRLYAAGPLASNLHLHAAGVVDEDAIALIAHPEGDVLVRLVRRCASIGVPQRNYLAYLVPRSEALA